MADERLRYLIEAIWKGSGDTRKAAADIKEAGKAGKESAKGTDKASKSAGRLSGAMKGLIAGGAVLAAGHQMLQFGKQSIAAASSAQETSSLLENSLGPAARQFSKDIAEVAEATNRSRFQLEEGAATFVAMSRNMGLGQQAAADFSKEMTQVAVDLGSFFNRAESDVLADLQGALAGSSETMQKYGVDVRETTLKQRAYEMGLIEMGGELDRATRAQVILSETMNQASDAMGDAERTADSYENTARSLRAELHDLKVGIGEELIPATREGTGALAAMVRSMNDTIEARQTLRRAEELGIITSEGLTRHGAIRTEMTLEEIDALVESKEAAYDRAAAEDALRIAMEGGTEAIVANNREWKEANALIAKGADELRDARMEAALIEEGRRTLTWEFKAEVDDSQLQETTAQAQQIADLFERIEGREWTAKIKATLAGEGGRGVEDFDRVLEEKFTGVFRDREIEGPAISTTSVDMLSQKLGIADEQAAGVQRTVSFVDDTPVRTLSDTTTTAQEKLNTLQDGSPYESEVDHNLDSATVWAQKLKIAIDNLPTSKTITVNTVSVGGVNPQGGGPGYQQGADFVVPPGFQNDTFPFRASSGERVTVTPAGGGAGGGGNTWNGDLYVQGGNPDEVIRVLMDRGMIPRTAMR